MEDYHFIDIVRQALKVRKLVDIQWVKRDRPDVEKGPRYIHIRLPENLRNDKKERFLTYIHELIEYRIPFREWLIHLAPQDSIELEKAIEEFIEKVAHIGYDFIMSTKTED